MPTYKVITEPLAQVTVNWGDISTIKEGLYLLRDQGGSFDKEHAEKLIEFFDDVHSDMAEVL